MRKAKMKMDKRGQIILHGELHKMEKDYEEAVKLVEQEFKIPLEDIRNYEGLVSNDKAEMDKIARKMKFHGKTEISSLAFQAIFSTVNNLFIKYMGSDAFLVDADLTTLPNVIEQQIARLRTEIVVLESLDFDNRDKDHEGLYRRYLVMKPNGDPVYDFKFVLSPEKDEASREALKTYAKKTRNLTLRQDLFDLLETLPTLPSKEEGSTDK